MVVHHRRADQWEALKGQVAAFIEQFVDDSVGLLPEPDAAVAAAHGPTKL